MKAKLVVEGKEFDIEILDPKLQELISPKKKTGYERACKGGNYYVAYIDKGIRESTDSYRDNEDSLYENAAYYSDRTVAENNARADRLMRQLRRFAVEHRAKELSWNIGSSYKWCISYDYHEEILFCHQDIENRAFGAIYFDSKSHAKLAIETFKDELIWYFTEYRDSL